MFHRMIHIDENMWLTITDFRFYSRYIFHSGFCTAIQSLASEIKLHTYNIHTCTL